MPWSRTGGAGSKRPSRKSSSLVSPGRTATAEVSTRSPVRKTRTVTGPAGTQTYPMDQLRQAAPTTISVDEPFVKQRIEFTGVPMATLFDSAGITGDTVVNTVALNDYAYDAPASVFTDSDAIIAVGQAGGDIPVDQGGPIRVVFPDGTAGATNLDAWNWSIERIEVV